MSERNGSRGGGSGGRLLSGAVIVLAIAAALGVFGKQSSLQRPKLSAVNIIGIVLMLAGLVLTLLAPGFSKRASASGRDVTPLVKMAGVLVCGIGAALVFL